MFRVDRKKSDRIISSIKYMVFASILMLSPIQTKASTKEEITVEHDNSKSSSKIKIGLIAIPLIYVLITNINAYHENIREDEEKKKEKKKDSE